MTAPPLTGEPRLRATLDEVVARFGSPIPRSS